MRQVSSSSDLDALRREAGEARRVLNYTQAIALNQRRLDGWRKRDNPNEEVQALQELAQDHLALHEPLVAFACLAQARARSEGNAPLHAKVEVTLSDLYTQLGLVDQALALLEAQPEDPASDARLMQLHLGRGNVTRARVYFERNRRRYQAAGARRQEANLVLSWGTMAQDRTAQAEGVALLETAISEAHDAHERVQMLGLRASFLGLLNRDDEAKHCFKEALTLAQAPALWQERASTLGAFASFCYFSRLPDSKARAKALVQELLGFARQNNSLQDERGALQKQLDFARYERDWPTVVATGNALILLCLEHGWRHDVPYFQEEQAQALQALGRRVEATAACRAAVAVLEQRRRTYAGLSEADRAFRQGNRTVYERLLRLLPSTSPEVFPLVQQLKARVLREQVGRVRTLPPAPEEAALRARCAQLNAALVGEGLHNEVGGKKRFATLQGELHEAEQALARYYDQLHARSPETALRHVAASATQAQVQAQLGPRTVLLDFVVSSQPEEPIRLVVLTARDARLCTLATPATELRAQVVALRQACSRPDRPWADAAKALAQSLLAPLEGYLAAAEQVVVCPDGFLWDVPFAVLLRSPIALVHAFSAALWHQQRTRLALPQRPVSVLAIAAPQTPSLTRPIIAPERPIIAPERPIIAPERGIFLPRGASVPPLPGAAREVRTLARLFAGTRVLEGPQAQEGRVKTELGRCRWLHVAAHAFLNDTSPDLSCLVLSDPEDPLREDGFLTARELAEQDLTGLELATLSACNTARGQLLTGEGVRGLSWALTVAGARHLVLSQWSVADDATADYMEGFYTALHQGKSKPHALQHAAQALRQQPGRAHPYYWAAFILIGAGDA